MNKILFTLTLCICAIVSYAQDASYTYKPLAKEGCHVEYSALKQDNKSYIIVSVRSDEGLCFVNDPVMMLRTGNNEVIKLTGTNMGSRKDSSSGVVIGNVVVSGNNSIGMAQFELTDEQVEMLNTGVIKVRLTTTPFIHEREFTKDKIGKKLYKAFSKQKNAEF